MNVEPIPLDPGPMEVDTAEQSQYTTYILYYTTGQGTIEEAEITADTAEAGDQYLAFYRDNRLVTSIPHRMVLQFGELEESNRSFKPTNPDDEGSYIEFAPESKDPWANLTGKK